MIDTSLKYNTLRYAKAQGRIKANKGSLEKIKNNEVPKGNVLEIARSSAISTAKKTSELIIMCHPLPIDWININYKFEEDSLIVEAEVKAIWRTGVEMEALSAVSAALLNIYDMLKPIDDNLEITDIRLVEKKGGKSDFRNQLYRKPQAAVIVISDSTYAGKRKDKSGKIIIDFIKKHDIDIKEYKIIPDDIAILSESLLELTDKEKLDLIITTGGTGLGPRDITPETTSKVIDKEAIGITEAIRAFGKERTPFSILSRGIAGIRGKTLIINLPGSAKAVTESLHALFPVVLHAFPMIWGEGHLEDEKEG